MVYVVRWGKYHLLEQLNTISPQSSNTDLTALLTQHNYKLTEKSSYTPILLHSDAHIVRTL